MPHRFYGPDGDSVLVDHEHECPEGYYETPKAFLPEDDPLKQSYYDQFPERRPSAVEPEPQDDEDDLDEEIDDATKAVMAHTVAEIIEALKARNVPIGRDRNKLRLAKLLAQAEAEDDAHEESLQPVAWNVPTDDDSE